VLLAGSAALLAVFLARERRSANPVIDPALFRDRRFTWGTVATVAVTVALFGILFVVPQYLQSVVGDDPISAGLRLLPMMGGLLIAGGAAGQVVRAAGTRLTVAAGLAVLTGGLVMLSQIHLATGFAYVAAGLAVTGLGTGGRISTWDFTAHTGPEFSEPGRGTYQLEQIPLTVAGLDAIDLKPTAVAGLLRDAIASGRDLFTLPDLRSAPAAQVPRGT
jgi:hypothetical protein